MKSLLESQRILHISHLKQFYMRVQRLSVDFSRKLHVRVQAELNILYYVMQINNSKRKESNILQNYRALNHINISYVNRKSLLKITTSCEMLSKETKYNHFGLVKSSNASII